MSTVTPGLVPMLSVEEGARVGGAIGMRPEMANIHFYRMLLNSPHVGLVENHINDEILWKGLLAKRPEANRYRELAIMRVGWVSGSEYLWAHHYAPVVDKKLPGHRPDNVMGVRQGAAYEGFDEGEKAVMNAVDEMLRDGRVSAGTVTALRSHLESDGELVELVWVIGVWNALASVMKSLETPLEEGYEAWAPDGVGPQR
jgi:alkylhydroperoxidase family enzyme